MATAELLAMMTHKTISYFGGSGGIPQMTPEMVAAACAGLKDGPYYLGMAKYAGDMSSVRDLKIAAHIEAAKLAVDYGWKIIRGKPYLQGIAILAAYSALGRFKCADCEGAGVNQWQNQCKRCKGSGDRPLDNSKMARIAGIPDATFRQGWHEKFQLLARQLDIWDSELMTRVSRNLKDIDNPRDLP